VDRQCIVFEIYTCAIHGATKQALEDLRTYLAEKQEEQRVLVRTLRALPDLNHRQRALLDQAMRHPDELITFQSHALTHDVTYVTARSDLLELVDRRLLDEVAHGRQRSFLPSEQRPCGARVQSRPSNRLDGASGDRTVEDMSALLHAPPPAPIAPAVPAPPRPRKARDALITVTCVVVILAVIGNAFETVSQHLAAAAAAAAAAAKPSGPQPGHLEESAYTNAEAAHLTLTNLNAFPVEGCLRAIVTGKAGRTVVSVPVCTGEMKPRTTVVLVAPYRIGEVMKVCAGEPDRWGNPHLDWSTCSFTTEPVKD
jgi:hypothetical protein